MTRCNCRSGRFTALFFYRGLARGRALDWMLAGAMLALAFWSKYAAFALAISLGAVSADRSGGAADAAHAQVRG